MSKILRSYYIVQLAPVAIQCRLTSAHDGDALNQFQSYLARVSSARTYRLVREDRRAHENGSNLVKTVPLATRQAKLPLRVRVREFMSAPALDRLWQDLTR